MVRPQRHGRRFRPILRGRLALFSIALPLCAAWVRPGELEINDREGIEEVMADMHFSGLRRLGFPGVVFVLVVLLSLGSAFDETRVALVIGNGRYGHADKVAYPVRARLEALKAA
jgi:hypothetical protein